VLGLIAVTGQYGAPTWLFDYEQVTKGGGTALDSLVDADIYFQALRDIGQEERTEPLGRRIDHFKQAKVVVVIYVEHAFKFVRSLSAESRNRIWPTGELGSLHD
jgi:hypothetical protein